MAARETLLRICFGSHEMVLLNMALAPRTLQLARFFELPELGVVHCVVHRSVRCSVHSLVDVQTQAVVAIVMAGVPVVLSLVAAPEWVLALGAVPFWRAMAHR